VNGVHDMGGQHGLGAIVPEPESPPFHAGWEARTHAMVIASPTRGNIDAGRHQRERIPGARYLAMSYYERWFEGLCQMLLAGDFISPGELATAIADPAAAKASPRLTSAEVPAGLARAGSYLRSSVAQPAFAVGDCVRARNLNPTGHTRLPRYARGRVGVVTHHHGAHVFPDSHAHGGGEDPHPLYTVRFTARELWGSDASPKDTVSLDLWEPYLERS
jgi:nitrile hydratase beta subunit